MRTLKETRLLMVLTMGTAIVLLVSNLAASKIWSLGGIPVDGGIICFPLSYILGDLLVEFFGREQANLAARVAATLNLISMVILFIVCQLPAHPDWEGQEAFATIFGYFGRVTIASLIAFLASAFLNNYTFTRIREKHGSYFARAIGSSAVARLADSFLFETIAFFGVLPFGEFLEQAVFAYFAGLALETLMAIPALKIHSLIKKSLE